MCLGWRVAPSGGHCRQYLANSAPASSGGTLVEDAAAYLRHLVHTIGTKTRAPSAPSAGRGPRPVAGALV